MGSKNPERCAPTLSDSTSIAYLAERFPDWRLFVYCGGCVRTRKYDPRELLTRTTPPATVGELRARVSCGKKCREDFVKHVKPVLKARRER